MAPSPISPTAPAAPAGYIELVQMSPKWRRLHAWLREEARGWDGRDPVRHTVGANL